jgi:ankyrin repeat protein
MRLRSAMAVAVMALCAARSQAAASGDPRLLDAIKNDNRETVRELVKSHADPNTAEADGTTALHWAVRADNEETVRLLLKAGARVNAANRYGVTPLALAATNGRAPMIEILLTAGADANATLPEGETVLMTAARTGDTAAVTTLLAHGANVNAKEQWLGETALMWAAAENHGEVIPLLIQHGADVNVRSKTLEFPKINFNGSTMVSTPLPRGSMTALMMAARQDALEGVRALTEGGADLNLADPDGTSALVMSIVNGHFEVAQLLLEKGADPNVADASGMAALYAAVDMHTPGPFINRPSRKPTGNVDSVEIIKMILDRGGNPNTRLRTPTLQRYHNGGDAQLTDGATPLMRAAKSTDVAVMRLLLDKGADPNLATRNLTTPMMFAAGLGGGRGRSDDAAVEALALCLKHGADINAFNNTGQTALHIAVERSNRLVEFLASQGAELDLKDKDGRTPLDVALGVSASSFQGRRGAAPSVVRESTATLLRQLMSGNAPKTTSSDPHRLSSDPH